MGGVRRRKRVIIDDAMAVYTHLSSAMLHEHLHPFGLGELQAFEGISGGTINTIYAIQTSKGRLSFVYLRTEVFRMLALKRR